MHDRLEEVVRRNLESSWRQPLHAPTAGAFEKLTDLADFSNAKLILDSGCGTGASTISIAKRFPDCLVIGVDRSIARLSRQGDAVFPLQRGNVIWLQAELTTFWRLALGSGWQLHRHFLLYPNPSPKPGHLQRRWHAHPVFPQMLELGGTLEMRCNWKIYADEFAMALKIVRPDLDIREDSAESEQTWGEITTPFGAKYGQSGHRLYRVVAS